jgi:1-acyl-sn-glycerol-3-phosphate acyltransferase
MTPLIAQKITWIKGKIILNLFFRVRVEGRENLEGLKPPCLLASNHRTYLDHFFILSALPWRSPLMPVHMMALDVLYRHGIIKFFLNLFGAFPSCKGKGIDASLAIPATLLKEGKTVGLYPEGHRAHDMLFGEPRRGAALLALRMGVPIVPIALVGFEGGMKARDWFTRAWVTIRFGEPFLLTEKMGIEANPGFFHDDPVVWEGAEIIMEKIKTLYMQ